MTLVRFGDQSILIDASYQDVPVRMVYTRRRHTLGEAEVAVVKTLVDGSIDTALEHGIGGIPEVVVGLEVLLDGLTAVERQKSACCSQAT